MYGFLADLIVGIHVAYVSSVLIGLLLILFGILLRWSWIRNPWFRLIHLSMILIVAFEALIEFECPLTTWEYQLRQAAGQRPDDISFMGRMLRGVLFYDPGSEEVLTLCYYAVAGLVLATFLMAPPRFRRRRAAPGAPAASPSALAPMTGDLHARGMG
jgi:hypothetical protein